MVVPERTVKFPRLFCVSVSDADDGGGVVEGLGSMLKGGEERGGSESAGCRDVGGRDRAPAPGP